MADTTQVFISHARDDDTFVHDLIQALDKQGVPHWSDRNLRPGARWSEEIESAISRASMILLIISQQFETSKYALFEAGMAVGRAKESGALIVPILLPGAKLPPALRGYQAIQAESTDTEALAKQLQSAIFRMGSRVEPVFRTLRLFISSAADTKVERELVIRVVEEINARLGVEKHVLLKTIMWESFSASWLSPQHTVEEAIKDVDVFLLLLSARIGTVLEGVPFIEKELQLAQENWRQTGRPQILCYLKTAPVKLDTIDQVEQYRHVLEFRDRLRSDRLVYEFESTDDFESVLRNHLVNIVESTGRLTGS